MAKKQQRKWVREEVVILAVEYFRTKDSSDAVIEGSHIKISQFLRKGEEKITGLPVSDIFRDYAGIHMQSGRIRCLNPDTPYDGMKGKLYYRRKM